jgi:hypothetical protein
MVHRPYSPTSSSASQGQGDGLDELRDGGLSTPFEEVFSSSPTRVVAPKTPTNW